MKDSMAALVCMLSITSTDASELERSAELQRAVMVDQDPTLIRSLVANGVNLSDPIGCGTFAPLDGAVLNENASIVDLLLSLGARPEPRQIVRAAFVHDHRAALQMVKLLHKAGASVNAREHHSQTGQFTTPIHQAVWRENVALVRYLLSTRDVRLNEINWDGHTPVMIAAEKGNAEILSMLLEAGAQVQNADG